MSPLMIDYGVDFGGDATPTREITRTDHVTVGELSREPHSHAWALARLDPFRQERNETVRRTGVGRRTSTRHFEQGPVVVNVAELDIGRADVNGQNLNQFRVMERRHLEIVVR